MEVGKKIKEIRKKKGLSQEELSEAANINLRTIQRIEKNESEPRGSTLNLICKALGTTIEDLLDFGKEADKNYILFMHLSVISFLFFPLGNVILPLILWLTKKDKILGLKETGANLLNFQILWTVLTFIAVILYTVYVLYHFPGGKFFLVLFGGLYLINIVIPIIFAIKARKGYFPKYPIPFRLIR